MSAVVAQTVPALEAFSLAAFATQVFFISLVIFTAALTTIFWFATKFRDIRFYCAYTWAIVFVLLTESPIRELFLKGDLYTYCFLLSHCVGGTAFILFFADFCERYIHSKSLIFRMCLVLSIVSVAGSITAPRFGVLFLVLTGVTTSTYLAWVIFGVFRTVKIFAAFKIYMVSVLFLIGAVVIYLLRISGTLEWKIIAPNELLIGQTIEIFGGLIAVVFHYIDAQNEKKNQEIILNRQLNQHKRLSALGLMAGGIAHEINNPLSIIKSANSNLEYLLKDRSDADVRRYIKEIDLTVGRISEIVTSLAEMAKGKQDYISQCNVTDAITQALQIVKGRCQNEDINITVEAFEHMDVECHLVSLCQAVKNVLDNAIYEIRNEKEKWIRINFKIVDQFLYVAISNSGPKISDHLIDSIFDPFFTTKPVGNGMGLGLTLSKSLLVSNGADLVVDSETPHTTFVLQLKIANVFPMNRQAS